MDVSVKQTTITVNDLAVLLRVSRSFDVILRIGLCAGGLSGAYHPCGFISFVRPVFRANVTALEIERRTTNPPAFDRKERYCQAHKITTLLFIESFKNFSFKGCEYAEHRKRNDLEG